MTSEQEFDRLFSSWSSHKKMPEIGDIVVIADGLIRDKPLWSREQVTVCNVIGDSVYVQFNYEQTPGGILIVDAGWIHPALIVGTAVKGSVLHPKLNLQSGPCNVSLASGLITAEEGPELTKEESEKIAADFVANCPLGDEKPSSNYVSKGYTWVEKKPFLDKHPESPGPFKVKPFDPMFSGTVINKKDL